MPITRGQYRRYCEDNPFDYLSQQSTQSSYVAESDQSECEACSQHSQASSNHSFDYDPEDNDEPYAANDHCKRHRKPDGEEKTEEVVSYTRRKPRH